MQCRCRAIKFSFDALTHFHLHTFMHGIYNRHIAYPVSLIIAEGLLLCRRSLLNIGRDLTYHNNPKEKSDIINVEKTAINDSMDYN